MIANSREFFFQSYQLWQKGEIGDFPLIRQGIQLVKEHNEYHHILADPNRYLNYKFNSDEQNPFLHLALHLSLLEQLQLDSPEGIVEIYQSALHRGKNQQEIDHTIMAQLYLMLKRPEGFQVASYLKRLVLELK